MQSFNHKTRGNASEDVHSYLRWHHGCTDYIPVAKTVRHMSLNHYALWLFLRWGFVRAYVDARALQHKKNKKVIGLIWETMKQQEELVEFDLAVLAYEFTAMLMPHFLASAKTPEELADFVSGQVELCTAMEADDVAAKAEFERVMKRLAREREIVRRVCKAHLIKLRTKIKQFTVDENKAARAQAEQEVGALTDSDIASWTTSAWTSRHSDRLRIIFAVCCCHLPHATRCVPLLLAPACWRLAPAC